MATEFLLVKDDVKTAKEKRRFQVVCNSIGTLQASQVFWRARIDLNYFGDAKPLLREYGFKDEVAGSYWTLGDAIQKTWQLAREEVDKAHREAQAP